MLGKVVGYIYDRCFRQFVLRDCKSTILNEYLVYGDINSVDIADTAIVNNALFNTSSGRIQIDDYVFFGHGVSLLTGTHDYRLVGHDRQMKVPRAGRDIIVEYGAWISSNAIILGPCRIGRNAVVAAGSVVTHDVSAHTIVAGVPARVVRTIESGDKPSDQPESHSL